jgi:hypothetical protein
MAAYETPASKQAVLAIGKAIAVNRKNPPEPEILKAVPLHIDSVWELRKDRLSFFRSYLVLNSIYYLSHENILNLDHSTEGVIATYEHIPGSTDQTRSRCLLVKYKNHKNALKALKHFHDTYLPEQKKDFTLDSVTNDPKSFKIEDGWLSYKLLNRYIVIVFECPDLESARIIIQNIESNLMKRGGLL